MPRVTYWEESTALPPGMVDPIRQEIFPSESGGDR